jgi:hypothetical protein
MRILDYGEREELKRMGAGPEREHNVDWSHWHRFLEMVYFKTAAVHIPSGARIGGLGGQGDGSCVLPDNVSPDFDTYRKWKTDFPGWSYGPMFPEHSAWRDEYRVGDLPMNRYYNSKYWRSRLKPYALLWSLKEKKL